MFHARHLFAPILAATVSTFMFEQARAEDTEPGTITVKVVDAGAAKSRILSYSVSVQNLEPPRTIVGEANEKKPAKPLSSPGWRPVVT